MESPSKKTHSRSASEPDRSSSSLEPTHHSAASSRSDTLSSRPSTSSSSPRHCPLSTWFSRDTLRSSPSDRMAELPPLVAHTDGPPSADSHNTTLWRRVRPHPQSHSDSHPSPLSREHVDPPKKKSKSPIHKEQSTSWVRTRSRVVLAVSPLIDIASDAAFAALVVGVDVLPLVPIPGLQLVAKLLLNIWMTLKAVDSNQLACLRLTERCADILVAVREEIDRAGHNIVLELQQPMERLQHAFDEIHQFLRRQIDQPFLKRYLKRDETLIEIADCNTALNDCLNHFDRSILLRIMAYVSKTAETPILPEKQLTDSRESSLDDVDLPLRNFSPEPVLPSADEVLEALRTLQERQNERDRSRDKADLRRLLQQALDTDDDAEMIKMLQVAKFDPLEAIKTLLRALEEIQGETTTTIAVGTTSSTLSPSRRMRAQTWPLDRSETKELALLHRGFIEKAIGALKRESKRPLLPNLPSWTITKYEVDLKDLIGRGFFSSVYKGTWRGRAVAVKVLEINTPRELFVREIEIWKALDHRHVLKLYGASSAQGDLPWFLVSPFIKNGSLSNYLKRLEWDATKRMDNLARRGKDGPDFLGMMHDVAKGMQHLHEFGILHGDLRAANVLVDDDLQCLISDFGQSKWRSQVKHGNPPPTHALRWQAPELMTGQSLLSKKSDVYAYAMCCVEILTMGSIPWPTMHDDLVKRCVLEEGARPPYPTAIAVGLAIEDVLHSSWHDAPSERPSFSKLTRSLEVLRDLNGTHAPHSPSPRIVVSEVGSADDLLASPHPLYRSLPSRSASEGSDSTIPLTPRLEHLTPPAFAHAALEPESDSSPDDASRLPPSPATSFEQVEKGDDGDDDGARDTVYGVFDPAVLLDRAVADWSELTYRLCLLHEFPRSLTLPLWTPGDAALGDVGYLSMPAGRFVRLFNSINPVTSSGGRMAEVEGVSRFGSVSIVRQHEKEKSLTRRGLKAFAKLVSSGDETLLPTGIKRRYTFSLSGRRAAYLCAEKTVYQYMEDSRACKKWFKDNWDKIVQVYGAEHRLQKEDLMLLVETLAAQHYALFVNHGHSDGEAYFDVPSSREPGEPWGSFCTRSDTSEEVSDGGGRDSTKPLSVSKVSQVGSPHRTVLVARLRFQPDLQEPTLLP